MTCPKCNVEMEPSKAFENTLVGSPDFVGDTGKERGCTMSRVGPVKLIDCLKCPECGWSVTG